MEKSTDTTTIDIDLTELSKEELISIIVAANVQNITIEQLFTNVIISECERYKKQYEN